MPGIATHGSETIRATGRASRAPRRDRSEAPHSTGAPPANMNCAPGSFRHGHRHHQRRLADTLQVRKAFAGRVKCSHSRNAASWALATSLLAHVDVDGEG